MKILVADDHSVVRNGLVQILKELGLAEIVEEASDGNEALEKIMTGKYDFVILDISMPSISGLEILETLKARQKKANVLILSFYPHKQFAVRALKLGASGYLSKDSAREELTLAIKKISAGEKYISSEIVENLVSGLNKEDGITPHSRLSEREFQVLCLLAKGISIVEIGEKLYLSENTISTYRTRLLQKMQMKSNADLTLYAHQNKLIE
jgi:DNA-binding NarL/FixJ family response regulator